MCNSHEFYSCVHLFAPNEQWFTIQATSVVTQAFIINRDTPTWFVLLCCYSFWFFCFFCFFFINNRIRSHRMNFVNYPLKTFFSTWMDNRANKVWYLEVTLCWKWRPIKLNPKQKQNNGTIITRSFSLDKPNGRWNVYGLRQWQYPMAT